MRFSNLLLVTLLFCIGCRETKQTVIQSLPTNQDKSIIVAVEEVRLHPEQGLVFHQGEPFTGTSISYFPSGKPATSIEFLRGKKDGKYLKWFDNGIKSVEANYVAGKQQGTTSTWWRNGNLRSVSNFNHGVAEGIQQQWYASGAKFKKINLKAGREEGLQQSWRENGKIYNNYEAKNGRVFGLKRAKLCYELDNEIVQYNPG